MTIGLEAFEAIQSVIAPYIGETMAGAAIRAQCSSLGFEPEEIDSENIGSLIRRLSQGLRVFLGAKQTETVVREIQWRLGDGGKI